MLAVEHRRIGSLKHVHAYRGVAASEDALRLAHENECSFFAVLPPA